MVNKSLFNKVSIEEVKLIDCMAVVVENRKEGIVELYNDGTYTVFVEGKKECTNDLWLKLKKLTNELKKSNYDLFNIEDIKRFKDDMISLLPEYRIAIGVYVVAYSENCFTDEVLANALGITTKRLKVYKKIFNCVIEIEENRYNHRLVKQNHYLNDETVYHKKVAAQDQAKASKDDEFYTTYMDVYNELSMYKEFFRGKKILCNCDDTFSNFNVVLSDNFDNWGLAELVCTHYVNKADKGGSSIVYTRYKSGGKPSTSFLEGDGDFRSPECEGYLKKADIVITNPPFAADPNEQSNWYKQSPQVVLYNLCKKYNKKFLMVATMKLPWFKELQVDYMEGKFWHAYVPKNDTDGAWYQRPDYIKNAAMNAAKKLIREGKWKNFKDIKVVVNHREITCKYNKFVGEYGKDVQTAWFTNLPTDKQVDAERWITEEDLVEKRVTEYIPFVNRPDIVFVKSIRNIEKGYKGLMAVNHTALRKLNCNLFDIVEIVRNGKESKYSTFDPVIMENGKRKKINAQVVFKFRDDVLAKWENE